MKRLHQWAFFFFFPFSDMACLFFLFSHYTWWVSQDKRKQKINYACSFLQVLGFQVGRFYNKYAAQPWASTYFGNAPLLWCFNEQQLRYPIGLNSINATE